MKYWVFMCLLIGVVINDEVVGWLALVMATLPPFIRLCLRLGKVIERENSHIGYGFEYSKIDENGFYE